MPQTRDLPWKLRLIAWWRGYDIEDVHRAWIARQAGDTSAPEPVPDTRPARPAEVRPPSPVDPDDPELPFDPWDANRVEIAQYIWGEGYCGPGGPEHIISMSKLLTLSPEQSLLQIDANLGGPARTLADKFGVWVTGYERSPRLVTLANEKSHMAGMSKKVAVHHYDPEKIEEFDRRFDRALAKETLFTIEDKLRLLSVIEANMKSSGLFLITDLVLGSESAVATQAYKDWRDAEEMRRRPYMVTAPELADIAKKAHFNIRVNEDITEQYIEIVNRAWAGADQVAAKVRHQEDGEALLLALAKEAEFWNHRVRLLREGSLRVWRLLASKKAEKPSMMSDW